MKALYIPLVLLSGMLAFGLWTGAYAQAHVVSWRSALQDADRLAQEENWEAAEEAIRRGYADWNNRQVFLHVIMEHAELDEAEVLFSAAFAACDARDVPDFHAALGQLDTQLNLLAETQQLSIQNVF